MDEVVGEIVGERARSRVKIVLLLDFLANPNPRGGRGRKIRQ